MDDLKVERFFKPRMEADDDYGQGPIQDFPIRWRLLPETYS